MTTPSFCEPYSTIDTATLGKKALEFLTKLNLPRIHPHCESLLSNADQLAAFTKAVKPRHVYSGWDNLVTTVQYQTLPPLLAMGQLWMSLFAFYIAPLAFCYLLHAELTVRQATDEHHKRASKFGVWEFLIMTLGVYSALILCTDPMYVQEFGDSNAHRYGSVGLFIGVTMLSYLRMCRVTTVRGWDSQTSSLGNFRLMALLYVYISMQVFALNHVCVTLLWSPEESGLQPRATSEMDLPPYPAGLYYDTSNPLIASIVDAWPESSRTYDAQTSASAATPTSWTNTGDSRTGIPFLIHSTPPNQHYRVWVPVEDDEAVALDIAFPPTGEFDPTKPVYLILHGLNGGSNEEYVREFVTSRLSRGSTVAIMITRGLMNTPVFGNNVFHGARVSDVDVTAQRLKNVLQKSKTVLAGVGYSMGAIILSNYVARSGPNCYLDTAVAISGGLDMRGQLDFHRSMRLWQPMLASELREMILVKHRSKYEERLSKKQFRSLLRATSITEIDVNAVVNYNKDTFKDIEDYYTQMSAMGDYDSWSHSNGTDVAIGRIGDVSVPFCVIHALDDPLISWRTMGHNPTKLVQSSNGNGNDKTGKGKGNLVMLLTNSGGHVGWPLGSNPTNHNWSWMHNAAGDFVDGFTKVVQSKGNKFTLKRKLKKQKPA
eukprot:CAMPEP_0194360064 /NCGR_PEP_ID=MMETSP0174-20130528/7375_1 /TAXON_ID=216777 /ORGANISM="Proboscia alata, Strain PI-D3" /LENGTH=656 /DNA_ID=CAMNT_0039131343 /DNA_START=324 /DNA_END=2294 /DNA_ORIENTATION=+